MRIQALLDRQYRDVALTVARRCDTAELVERPRVLVRLRIAEV